MEGWGQIRDHRHVHSVQTGIFAAGSKAVVQGEQMERGASRIDLRRTELREFLMNRRARLSPRDFGMPDAGRRRTPGLRREEVAVLAGVGISWYQWLEQGRAISVSPQVLDSVARVLRMDEVERGHLYALAGLNPPSVPPAAPCREVDTALIRVLGNWMPFPAHIVDPYWNLVTMNPAAQRLLGYDSSDRNYLKTLFTNLRFRACYADWAAAAPRVVAQYRAEMTARPDDPGFQNVVDDLLRKNAEFAELWQRRDVVAPGVNAEAVTHPEFGVLFFDVLHLRVPQYPELRLILHSPRPAEETGVDTDFILRQARVLPAAA